MRRFIVFITAWAFLLACGPAFAHAFLERATPAVGSTVATAPTEVAIEFTEGVEPAFSTIAVSDAAGARVDSGSPKSAPGDDKRLTVGLKPLKPGSYKVEWHATSVDTHKTQGSFSFSVGP